MAGNRCISNDILMNDNFVRLPSSAKILYVYINNSTDDKGFCDNVASIMRIVSARQPDLTALITNRYLIKINDWLYLEKHFYLNNKGLRKERLKSRYDEYLKDFTIKDGRYTMADKCQTVDGQMADNETENVNVTKHNLTELNLTEHNITKPNTPEELKALLRGQ